MESIGQILKTARERRQISIADVVMATKMTSTFVKAIEANNFDVLVAPVYARGFIKLYAECVGLDPMPLQQQFDVSSRAAPLPSSKAPPRKASVAYAEKLKSPRLQQSGPPRLQQSGHLPRCGATWLPRDGATGKPEQEKVGGQSRSIAGRKDVSPAVLATTAPLRVDAHTPIPSRLPSWLVSLFAGRLFALNRMFSARVQWPRFNLPGRMFTYFSFPVIVWRRIFIVAGVVLLIIAASLAWEWSHRGLSSTTDACRWLAEPPAPYLTMDAHPALSGQ